MSVNVQRPSKIIGPCCRTLDQNFAKLVVSYTDDLVKAGFVLGTVVLQSLPSLVSYQMSYLFGALVGGERRELVFYTESATDFITALQPAM